MEYLKAWIWTQQKLKEKGEPAADETLVKYVEGLLNSMQSLLDTKLVRRTKTGNFELAELADLQVENRILRDCVEFYADHTHVDYNTKHARKTLEKLNAKI